MKRLLQKGLNRLFLCIATATILAVIVFAGAFKASPAFSYAENEKIAYNLNSHYVSFGEILAFDVSENGNIALIERDDSTVYFRLLEREGKELFRSELFLTEGLDPQIAAFNDKIVIYNEQSEGEAFLKVFDVKEKTFSNSSINVLLKLTNEFISITYPFKGFNADEKQGVLIVNYGISLFWYRIDDLSMIRSLKSSEVFDKSDKSFDIVEVAKESENASLLYLAEDNEKSTEMMTFHLSYSYQKDRTEPFYWQKVNNDENTIASLPRYNGKIYFDAFSGGVTLTEKGIEGLTSNLLIPFGENDADIQNVQSFKEQDGELYVSDNGQNAIKIFDNEGQLVEMLATYGNGIGDTSKGLLRFNSPSLVSINETHTAVYDKGNSRILLLNEDLAVVINQKVEGEVQSLITFDNALAYVIGSSIFIVEEEYVEPLQYHFDEKILSLCFDGTKLYAFTKDNCYIYERSSFIPISKESIDKWGESLFEKERDFSKIIGGNHDGILYLFDDLNHSAVMYKDYVEVVNLTELPEYESVSCDIKGNIWFLNGSSVYKYERELNSFELKEYSLEAPFTCLKITATGKAVALTEHTVAVLELDTPSNETDVAEVEEYDYPCSSIETLSGVWGYQNPDNFESVIYLQGEVKYPLFKTVNYNGNAYYYTELCRNGKYIKVFLPETQANELEMGTAEEEYVKYSGIDREPKGYKYPSNLAPSVFDIERGVGYKVLGLISLTADGLGNDWYLLEYNDQRFYVKKEGYVKDEKHFVEIERYFVRAKTDKSGGKIYIYATPSLDGEVVDWITDGTKIELTEEFNENSEFSEIRYNDKIAYILSTNVQAKGLTSGQNFAIIFSVIIIGVTASLLVIAKIVKQRRRKK